MGGYLICMILIIGDMYIGDDNNVLVENHKEKAAFGKKCYRC